MAEILTNEQNYSDIADTIRQMKNVNTTYKPREMASALKDIYSNEVEGVPPLSFEANGNNLLNYKIDGASGGVGDRTKNLLQNTATSQTINGVTFTVNDDESVTCNGTANETVRHMLGGIALMSGVQYKMSGCPTNGANNTYRLDPRLTTGSVVVSFIDNGNGAVYTPNADVRINVYIYIQNGYTCDNLTFYPMIRLASIQDDTYEPYGYKVPVVINGKNLLNTKLSTIQLGAGITFQKNNDGTVVVNGTPSSNFSLLAFPVYLTAASYVLSGCPESQDSTKLRCDLRDSQYATVGGYDIGNSVIISVNSPGNYFFGIRVGAGYNCNNLKFYPMIRLSTIEDDTYEQYIEPTTTNIYLDEPIEARANIPSEYEEVEYIESTGTQYIDTGIKVNTTTSRYETKINPSLVSDASGIFGTRNNTTADVRSMNVFIINGALRLDWLAGTASSEINISPNTEYTISITRGLATINNVDYTSEQTTSVNSLYTFYIGNFNNAGGPFSNGFSGKIYYSKLYKNNILVFDGVPCYRKSDNVAGLYDLVNNVFYTNQGTGNFIVGSIKENESISLSDTNVNIPTIEGKNVLTIDTTVQPSNVYIQAPKDSDEIIEIINTLEAI